MGHIKKTETLHIMVKKHYTKPRREWSRHEKHGGMEWITSIYLLDRYLPKRGLILDAGGGPGRYTIELAKKGHKIILLDPSQSHLDFADRMIKKNKLEKRVIKIVNGKIEDLSVFKKETFDAVICLGGPLSHVMSKKLREKAASELIRVAKRGAPIFVSVMNRLAIIRGELVDFQNELLTTYFRNWLKTGDYFGGYGFTPMHGFMPEELKNLFERRGAKNCKLFALEGFSSREDKAMLELSKNKRRWKVWIKTHFAIIDRLEVIGVSDHFMLICNK
jgi:ubiquinone/menaquinone biosynthesis C-methylase UbiE